MTLLFTVLSTSLTLPSCNVSPTSPLAALVNVSVENKPDGSVKGHVRLRSKHQGIALSLGDRVTAKQKRVVPVTPA